MKDHDALIEHAVINFKSYSQLFLILLAMHSLQYSIWHNGFKPICYSYIKFNDFKNVTESLLFSCKLGKTCLKVPLLWKAGHTAIPLI